MQDRLVEGLRGSRDDQEGQQHVEHAGPESEPRGEAPAGSGAAGSAAAHTRSGAHPATLRITTIDPCCNGVTPQHTAFAESALGDGRSTAGAGPLHWRA
ncbi:hypothetical protein GCM10022399_32850 [Terrabacter ginsenosidimutans]|uniref:Uncharacterized protein n=1 Tax=Terrabacter ginsenosidimutans TaxID=490575 RepID=A0ABP7E2X1_9MICO